MSGGRLQALKQSATQAVEHSSSGTRFKGEAPVNQLVVVPGDTCGLPARNRDGGTAPCYNFPLRHVQLALGCSLKARYLRGVKIALCRCVSSCCVCYGGGCDLFGYAFG